MRIHVLVENTTNRSDLTAEHGLSLLVESNGSRILFDAGASGAFADNAERMGVELSTVDFAVLSHGHSDHGGGLARFLELNSHASVWVSPYAFERHYNARGRDIGLDAALAEHPRICRVPQEVFSPVPGVTLFQSPDVTDDSMPDSGMTVQVGNLRTPEDFRHEQYMLLTEQGRRFLFTGCTHRGVLGVARYMRPDVLIGGFHFMRVDIRHEGERLRSTGRELLELSEQYWTGHCTGEAAFELLRGVMGDRLRAFHTGQVMDF